MRAFVAFSSLASLLVTLVSLGFCQAPPPEVKVIQTGNPKTLPLHLSFGVYQSDKATEMYRKFTPVIEVLQGDIERRLGRTTDIDIQIFKTYDDGIEALTKGKVDFVRFGPSSYIIAKAKTPAIELIAMELEDGKKQFNGVIVVPHDSKIQKLEDLHGKSFAFGDRNSTIGRYLVQEELLNAGIHASDLSRYDYLDRHDRVAAAVLAGDFDAGAVKESNFEEAKGKLRSLEMFPNVTKPWAVRAGLEPELVAALHASLLELKDPLALKALKVSGFCETCDAEYAGVQRSMQAAQKFESPPSGN